MGLANLRTNYHRLICDQIIRITGDKDSYPNFADKNSSASREFAWSIVGQLACQSKTGALQGQTTGGLFEQLTKEYIESSFSLLSHIRPGNWHYTTNMSISMFSQYKHLAELNNIVNQYPELSSTLGQDYIIKPDIVIGRYPISDNVINNKGEIIQEDDQVAKYTNLRKKNSEDDLILHASISCKWTIRSDRTQNTRTEALNLIRNRKGNLPHIMAVTAEPLPTRIAALALGTGDLDCVYHFALNELIFAVEHSHNEDQKEMLTTLVQGKRLRDISDLPFDLAI